MKEPSVTVGIMSGETIRFVFNDTYTLGDLTVEGPQEAHIEQGRIGWNGQLYDQLVFTPQHSNDSFCLKGVTIGVKFHWERQEDQTFRGTLKLIVEGDRLTAINELGIEEYLLSVISSEMSATASLELLKSHAVISRSWLLAQIQKNKALAGKKPVSCIRTHDELIRWYDREDHDHFDVCADDHCQRYQGITRESTPLVAQAIKATRGEILTYDGQTCDARFSKCCGGVMERFSSCWENIDYPYLEALRDSRHEHDIPDLRVEENARRWICSSPEAFCNTTDKQILSQVLNNYDQETTDFYRWSVAYTQQELASLIREKSGIDFGEIINLVPVERGPSGRLIRLQIQGTRQTLTIGKELEIRRTLSPSHLYSSAFVVEREEIADGIPRRFVLRGAGWGHGVGLCQIGAAVMGEQGYDYRHILLHYFAGATIEKLY
ncbi:SpoIID/LytB domain-containing protein [Barnesiella sp. An55]|uniref:SpoIID/LytB domain-containing protein n=1 Tax=Barnesiella sp. An55 TaxID=1965646 RepID=UPI000B374C27|nr:SpoIID/LytB domain-containing protein [Barnesiella sp. An55]OUN72496.1 amidase [Barnesiella sp. An55]HIZ25634.1 SpoIID/LytB domain-containing protein [Candidatus Barnesiella merdipullorum]